MAATTAPSAIDFKYQASFPIRLGSSVLKPSTSTHFTSIRCNHKPRFKSSENVKATVKPGKSEGERKLLLEDDSGAYKYLGHYAQDEDSYVLVVRGQGKDKEVVLERLESSHGFNLTSTPSQSDASVLAEKYPHLPEDDGIEDGLFGDGEDDTPPDESNPFDYRHFLKAELEKQEAAEEPTATSAAGTPLVRHLASASSPLISSKPAKPVKKAEPKAAAAPLKKRKAPAADKPNPKRVKAGQEPEPAVEAAKPKSKPEIPRISLDRKASLRRPSIDDSGELILENETPISEKPPKLGAMGLALSGQLGPGPISLMSAASSPGSRVVSPLPPRPAGMDEEYVFEFDDSPEPSKPEDDVVPEDDADEEEDDADVEDLELPSPAQAQHPNPGAAPAATTGGDDDDDLDKALALAMMEEDDGGNQESEESEEE